MICGSNPETFCWKPFPMFYLLPFIGGNGRRKEIRDAYTFFLMCADFSLCVYTCVYSFPCEFV